MRKAEDPKDAPEEPYGKLKLIEIGLNLWKKILDDIYYYYLLFILDHRSLFERLEENKRAKDAEYAQQHDIKNVVRGIDDDEAAFLDKVDEIKSVAELERIREERKELEEYKKMQEKLMEENEQKRLKNDVVTAKTNQAKIVDQPKKTQSKLLSGVLVRKRSASNNTTMEAKSSPLEPVPKKPSALAGLGDYGSSSDDSDQDD